MRNDYGNDYATDAMRAGEVSRKLFDGTATEDDLAAIANTALFIKAVTFAANKAATARRIAQEKALAETQRADALADIIVQAMRPNYAAVVL